MSVREQYQQKLTSAANAIAHIRNGDNIVIPTAVAEPPDLLTALSEQRRNFSDVKVSQILTVRKYGYLDPETVDNVRHIAYFFGAATRPGGKAGWIDYFPSYFFAGIKAASADSDSATRACQERCKVCAKASRGSRNKCGFTG